MLHDLIQALSKDELRRFQNSLSRGKRSFNLLGIMKNETNKEVIFKKLYHEKYSPEKDILLRTEMKILKRKLEEFILENSSQDLHPGRDYALFYEVAKWCMLNSIYDLALKYCRRSFDLALAQKEWADLLRINRVYYLISWQQPAGLNEKTEVLSERTRWHQKIINTLATEEMRLSHFLEASIDRYRYNLRQAHNQRQFPDTHTIHFPEHESELAAYFSLKAKAYSTMDGRAIDILKQAIALLKDMPHFYYKDQEWIAVNGALAMEYSAHGEHDRACEVFDMLIYHPDLTKSQSSIGIQFNYATTLLKLKQYRKAEEILELLDERHPKMILNRQIQTMKITTYLFLGESEKLKKIISRQSGPMDPALKIYNRLLFVIYYLQKDSLELAERELINLEKSRPVKGSVYPPLIQAFKLYIEAELARTGNSSERQKKQSEFRRVMEDIAGAEDDVLRSLLPYKWLQYTQESR